MFKHPNHCKYLLAEDSIPVSALGVKTSGAIKKLVRRDLKVQDLRPQHSGSPKTGGWGAVVLRFNRLLRLRQEVAKLARGS